MLHEHCRELWRIGGTKEILGIFQRQEATLMQGGFRHRMHFHIKSKCGLKVGVGISRRESIDQVWFVIFEEGTGELVSKNAPLDPPPSLDDIGSQKPIRTVAIGGADK